MKKNVGYKNSDLLLVNAVAAGAEASGAVGFAYIPPLLLKAGYTETQMSIMLLFSL